MIKLTRGWPWSKKPPLLKLHNLSSCDELNKVLVPCLLGKKKEKYKKKKRTKKKKK